MPDRRIIKRDEQCDAPMDFEEAVHAALGTGYVVKNAAQSIDGAIMGPTVEKFRILELAAKRGQYDVNYDVTIRFSRRPKS